MTLAELIKNIKSSGIKEEEFDKVNIVVVNGSDSLTATNRVTVANKHGDITAYVYLK